MLHGELAQHFLGWHFFRADPWGIPLGKTPSFLFPEGTSIVYTDSIPLMAILLKVFSPVLPDVFQYQGIWLLLSYTLQGFFASLLLGRVTKEPLPILLGTFFFVLSPTMFARAGGHESLSAHWTILVSLYLYLRRDTIRTRIIWAILLVLTSMIHFYLLVMTLIIWGGYLLRLLLINFRDNVTDILRSATITIILLITIMWITGYFVIDISSSIASGFGYYSMNLLAPLNPAPVSTIFFEPVNLATKGQYEGFNYQGFGLLLMILLSLYFALFKRNLFVLTRDLPLVIISLIFLLLALSNKVTLAEHIIFHIKIPDFFSKYLNILQASGRFFWPVTYILIVAATAILVKYNRIKRATIYILIALVIQFIELWPLYQKHNYNFGKSLWSSPLKSSLWEQLAEKYDHITFIPAVRNNNDYLPFAFLAATYDKTINVGYVARGENSNKREKYRKELLQKFKKGYISQNSLYVILDKGLFYKPSSINAVVGILDGYRIIAPDFITSSSDIKPWPINLK